MTELFNQCIEVVLKNEGGLSNDPDDTGGLTNFGISKRSFPDVDIENLTRDQAKRIYLDHYWTPLQLDLIENKNNALQIFDFAVNAGKVRAVKTAQRLAGVYVDGFMGPNTIAAINNMGNCFHARYVYARKEYYQYLVKIKPRNAKFLQGWINRVEHSKIYV